MRQLWIQHYTCHGPSFSRDTKSCCVLGWRKVGGDVTAYPYSNLTYSLLRRHFQKQPSLLFWSGHNVTMLWSFLLSYGNVCALVDFPSHLVSLFSIAQDEKRAKAALGWKMLTSQERGITSSLSSTLHALIPSHLQRYLTRRTVTQMSQLSQDCRRMNFPLQDLALKPLPRTAGPCWSKGYS